MRLALCLVAALMCALLPTASQAIDAPPGAEDLSESVEPLALRFDAEKGEQRLLLLLSPA